MKSGQLILLAGISVLLNVNVAFGDNPFRQSEPQLLSPNAAELGKYGKVPVNYFNGLPNITIPLTEVYAKGYTLPVYLTYYASGNKPDQHPGWVGMGWTLHAGGSITRIIKGQKDELSKEENAHNTGASLSYDPGYLYRAYRTQNNINWTNLDTLSYNCFWNYYTYYDYEPDEFIVSLEGLQASFYITGDGEIKIVSRNDASFDVSWTLGSDTDNTALTVYAHPSNASLNKKARRYTYLKSFTLRDREGNVYHFGNVDEAIEYSVSQKPNFYYSGGSYHAGSGWDATATANTWMLTKIERPDGEVITFTYKDEDSVPIVVHDFHYGDLYNADVFPSPAQYDTYSEYPSCKNNLSVTFLLPTYLESISCRLSGDHLDFGSSASTELKHYISQDDFALRVGDYTGTSFPLSYNDFMAKSYYLKLDTISGPGRSLSFNYTSNSNTRLKLLSVNFLNGTGGSTDHQYGFTYNTTPLPAYNSRMTDRWGFYNGHDYSSSIANYGHTMYAARYPDADYMQAEILTDIDYPTGGRTSFEYEPHTYYRIAKQYPFTVETCPQDSLAGGLRIKSITDITGSTTAEKRTFTYTGTYAGSTHSSGVLSGRQRFYHHGKTTLYVGAPYYQNVEFTYSSYSELPFNQLSETDGNHVTYSYVTETHQDGGSTLYHYSNHEDTFASDAAPTTILSPDDSNFKEAVKFNSGSLFRGLLLERKIRKDSGNNAIYESYTYDTSHAESLKSVSKKTMAGVVKLAAQTFIYCGFPSLTTKSVTTWQDDGSSIAETYTYQYNTERRTTSRIHSVGSNTDGIVTFYPADRSGATYTGMRQAGMSGVPVGQAVLRQGSVIAAQEMTFKETAVSTASGTSFTFVPEALYAAELTAPVNLNNYSSYPLSYCSDPDIRYLRYDTHANLTGTETRDGIRTTYAWDVSARQPVLVARGVDPGQTSIGNITEQQSYSLVYGQSNSFSGSYVSAQSATVTFTLQPAYGYDWLACVQVDSQIGYVVQVAIPETPPSQWMQYLSQYSNGSIQFTVPAGNHQYRISIIDVRKGTGASSNNGGSIQFSYSKKGTITTTGEPLLFVDFEDETTSQPGCHGQHCHSGSYTVNVNVGSTRNYVLDYMLYQNGAWSYQRQSYTGGSVTLGGSGKYLDDVRVFPADCDLATAGYSAVNLLTSRTDARGVTETYTYDNLRRLTLVQDNSGNSVESYSYSYAAVGDENSHVTTTTYRDESGNSTRTAVSYVDGLGRPTQNVLVEGAASGWDLVTSQDYDNCGREYRKWLPAPVQVGSGHAAGSLSTQAQILAGGNQVYPSYDSYRYGQLVYEASPRDHVKEYFGPGSDWRFALGNRTRYHWMANDASILLNYGKSYQGFSIAWTGDTSLTLTRNSVSASGTLQISRTEDEDGQLTLEFKDSFGQTVLVRRMVSLTQQSGYNDTYYVYDNLGHLAAVLPPEFISQIGSATSWSYSDLADYAYLYRYDSRGNCIAQSMPGAGWTYMVYDKGNRPVLSQDAAQRAQSAYYWTFALPDHLGRSALRGTTSMSVSTFSDPYKSAVVKASLPKTPTYSGTYRGYILTGISLSSADLLEVDYYDNYAFAGTSPFPAANNADFAYDSSIGTDYSAYYSPSAQGLQTGSLLKVLDNSTGNQYLWSVGYFDDKARVVQHRASTHLSGVEKDWFKFDLVGNVTKHKTEHKPSSGTSLVETTTQSYDSWDRPLVTQHQIGSGSVTTVSNKTYDKVGRLISESRNGTSALASTYQYNIRSWLTGIAGSLFNETLKYQDGPTPRWGGDISQLSWTDNQSSNQKTYSLAYDSFGRLTTASFSETNSSANFAESVTGYDGNGNITGLQRYGRTGASSYGLIDNLSYTYSGNRLSSVYDSGSAAYGSDFCYANGSYSYSFDAAGRMTSDASKGITSITWNVLGLPQTVTLNNGAVISYSYAADGTKLREARTASGNTTTTDYTGNLVLENGTRSRLLFDGGYVSMSNSGYHFFITDHLGSVRVVANTGGTAEEYNHYYPLGGPIAQYSSSTSLQPIKYQGKEWGADKGLQLYDFGARRYDPSTGKWISQDPLSEKYYAHSPYLFCAANPMRFVDPTGESTYVKRLEDGTYEVVDGVLDDDLNVYVVYSQNNQYIREYSIGTTAFLKSFYNEDSGSWENGSIINLQDSSAQEFMGRIMETKPQFLDYMYNARNDQIYDFKVSNGIEGRTDFKPYRGMLLGGAIVSARDVGNIAAGYVAGVNGIPYLGMRIMFDAYQSFTNTLKNNADQIERNPVNFNPTYKISIESESSRLPQRAGWYAGAYYRSKTR